MSVSFEEFIIQCCKTHEVSLRKWAKRILKHYGFIIKEDNYLSPRVAKNDIYKTVHNLLAIRGTPKVCLVAHTDVCRDHRSHESDDIYYGDPKNQPANTKMVEPVIKIIEVEDGNKKVRRRIIQDKSCETQVGGDDRLGVAINLWIAINTGYDMALWFPTDEEIGLCSARHVEFPELKEYELCVEVDRGNHSHELVTKIGSLALCDYDTTVNLLNIAWQMNSPRRLVSGNGTDIKALKERGKCKNAVNMTCGYHASSSASGGEYIDIIEARDTMRYVAAIVQRYACPELEEDEEQEEEPEIHLEESEEEEEMTPYALTE